MRALGVALGLLIFALALPPRGAPAEEEESEVAFERAPDPAEAPGPDADLYVEAVALQQAGKYVLARQKLRRLIEDHPDSPFVPEAIDRSGPNAFLGYTLMHEPRPSARRIDIALMGDGYLFEHQARFNKAAVGHLKTMLRDPALAAYQDYFCFWRFNLASRDKGVDEVERPGQKRKARTYSTALDCKAAGPQGQVMANPRRVWHYLSYLPENDALAVVFAKMGSLGMGGMGIATTGPRGVVVHEFGHAFAGLLDEYANQDGEPFGAVESANTTTNPRDPPWKHFLDAKVPGVGVYEGAATYKRGVWRPAPSCAMNTGGDRYCPVCREATVLTIYSYVSPVDDVRPPTPEITWDGKAWPAFEVVPMQPRTHDLEVTFHLDDEPPETPTEEEGEAPEDRFGDDMLTEDEKRIWERIKKRRAKARRALPTLIPVKPGLVRRHEGTGRHAPPRGTVLPSRKKRVKGRRVHVPRLPKQLAPGRYQLTAVVRDLAKPRGERHAWVLEDERGLLEDRWVWTLVVPEDDLLSSGQEK